MSRVLVLGGKSRLGAALARRWQENHPVRTLARPELDVSDLAALRRMLEEAEFDVLVNAIAMTNVDACETAEAEARVVNAAAPGVMAAVAAAKGARLIHFSTDYVFDGEKETAYVETDQPNPLGAYGRSKLAGEAGVMSASADHLVVRVSWIFGPDKPSFVDMVIERALASDRTAAIADKTSSPTYACDVAGWLEPFFDRQQTAGGIYHASNSGVCTWQQYGQQALDIAAGLGQSLRARKVDPISLSDMKSFVARRPPQTGLNTNKLSAALGRNPRPWEDALHEYLTKKFS